MQFIYSDITQMCLKEGVLLEAALRGLNAFIENELESPCEAMRVWYLMVLIA